MEKSKGLAYICYIKLSCFLSKSLSFVHMKQQISSEGKVHDKINSQIVCENVIVSHDKRMFRLLQDLFFLCGFLKGPLFCQNHIFSENFDSILLVPRFCQIHLPKRCFTKLVFDVKILQFQGFFNFGCDQNNALTDGFCNICH